MEDDPSYDISIAREDGRQPVSDDCLIGVVRATLIHHAVTRAEISIALVSDDHMATLNETHLDHEGPTDVLTFDLSDRAPSADPTKPPTTVDGEIVLSTDTASREAKARDHELDAELALYAVHGMLHLLGYDLI